MRLRCLFIIAAVCAVLLSSAVHAESWPAAAEAKIPVSCRADGSSGMFRFRITPETTEYQTVTEPSITLKNGESGTFDVSYTYPGTYHYTVAQEKGADNSITYDGTVYRVGVAVLVEEDGKYRTNVTVSLDGEEDKLDGCEFVNKVTAPVSPKPGQEQGGTDSRTSSTDRQPSGGTSGTASGRTGGVTGSTSGSTPGGTSGGTSAGGKGAETVSSVQTGDRSPLALWMVIFAMAGTTAFVFRKKLEN